MTDGTDQSTEQTNSTTSDADGGDDATNAAAEPDAGDTETSLMGGAGAADAGEGDDKEAGEDSGDGKDGPPETYELKVTQKAEDGTDQDIEIDTVLLEKATPVLKDLKLTNDQANKIAALVPEVQARIIQKQIDDHAALSADWAKQTKDDKDIGGKNWSETEALVARALDQFGAPQGSEFRKLLDETGLGNHPEMIRMFRSIGEKIGEGGEFVRGDAGAQVKVSREEVMYPDDVPKK